MSEFEATLSIVPFAIEGESIDALGYCRLEFKHSMTNRFMKLGERSVIRVEFVVPNR